MQIAHLNGIDLEFGIAGAGEPVLLISPVLADGFRPLLVEPALASEYQLITYHKRGWAGSTHTAPPVSVADHVADAAALLDHLGLQRVHVAGHSSGAAVAAQLALDAPARVHTLALLELSLLSMPAAAAFFQKAGPAFEAYAAGRHEQALAIFMAAVSGRPWEACRAILEQRVPGAVAQAIADTDTFFGIELPGLQAWTFGPNDAANIAAPVLSVVGRRTEPLWVEVAAALRSWFSSVEECTIDEAGHLLHIEQPARVAQGLAAFLARHPFAKQAAAVAR